MAERKSFLLRMDPALWAELEAWAQEELRSVNGQIEYLLRQAVQRRKGPAAPLALVASASPGPVSDPGIQNSQS
ncbi:MAG TPA: hypothetical protein PKM43_18275 [Verrucomicrobiota bacterium]|nr:hypothetical protein [Verrucomicrobiota bacterium]HRZ36273.1 hypothetical protein [Candidatus Paceibacterota bacterium]HRZ56136.1 hypothetical protein [Candidatus Paceibacterota bacterium]